MKWHYITIGISLLVLILCAYLLIETITLLKKKTIECEGLLNEKIKLTERLIVLKNENIALAQKNLYVEQQSNRMIEQFKSISNETVSSQSYSFIKVIEDHISKLKSASKDENQKVSHSIKELILPMENTIVNFEKVIRSFETKTSFDNREIFSKLSQVVTSSYNLQNEVNNVINSLRSPNVKGIWGEMQLKRLVQICGMEEHCDFHWQTTIERGLKPDMIINLPNGKRVIVDSKVSLSAYINCMDTNDEEKKKYYLNEHSRQIKTHITTLNAKKYWENIENSANFVVLFLPGECFLSAALEVNPAMMEYATKYNIILATPTTMIALLKTISYGWENIHISRDVEKIKVIIQNLSAHLETLVGDMQSMGKYINGLNNCYRTINHTLNNPIMEILEEVRNKYSTSTAPRSQIIIDKSNVASPKAYQSSTVDTPSQSNTIIKKESSVNIMDLFQSLPLQQKENKEQFDTSTFRNNPRQSINITERKGEYPSVIDNIHKVNIVYGVKTQGYYWDVPGFSDIH